MPTIVTASDAASLRAQRRFNLLTGASLMLLVIAAVFGVVHHEWAGWVSAGAFAGSVGVTALTLTTQARRDWHDGRAATESGKSLTFRYAVGGDPLGLDVPNARRVLHEQLGEIREELEKLGADIRASAPAVGTIELDTLRLSPREVRAEVYRLQRLVDQRDWYSTRAAAHRSTSRWWRAGMFAFQAAGIAGAVLKGLGATAVDWLAICATTAAAFAAWLETRDYETIARSYDFAALELAHAVDCVERESADEHRWSRFVADAEAAISREHSMWLARRRGAR